MEGLDSEGVVMANARRTWFVVAAVGVVALTITTTVVIVAANLGSGGKAVEVHRDDVVDDPASGAMDAFAGTKVFFGHQSVGANIISGLPTVYDGTNAQVNIVESRAVLTDGEPVLQHSTIGTNGDPASKIADFDALMRSGIGDTVDVALMKLCYVDFNESTDPEQIFASYVSTMQALEKTYPDVTFIYTTVPLTVDPGWVSAVKSTVKVWLGRADSTTPANQVRERYNALIRERYGDTGRLYDIAAGEASLGDGDFNARDRDGTTYLVMNPDLAADDGEHLNEQGSRQLAGQFVQVVGTAVGTD